MNRKNEAADRKMMKDWDLKFKALNGKFRVNTILQLDAMCSIQEKGLEEWLTKGFPVFGKSLPHEWWPQKRHDFETLPEDLTKTRPSKPTPAPSWAEPEALERMWLFNAGCQCPCPCPKGPCKLDESSDKNVCSGKCKLGNSCLCFDRCRKGCCARGMSPHDSTLPCETAAWTKLGWVPRSFEDLQHDNIHPLLCFPVQQGAFLTDRSEIEKHVLNKLNIPTTGIWSAMTACFQKVRCCVDSRRVNKACSSDNKLVMRGPKDLMELVEIALCEDECTFPLSAVQSRGDVYRLLCDERMRRKAMDEELNKPESERLDAAEFKAKFRPDHFLDQDKAWAHAFSSFQNANSESTKQRIARKHSMKPKISPDDPRLAQNDFKESLQNLRDPLRLKELGAAHAPYLPAFVCNDFAGYYYQFAVNLLHRKQNTIALWDPYGPRADEILSDGSRKFGPQMRFYEAPHAVFGNYHSVECAVRVADFVGKVLSELGFTPTSVFIDDSSAFVHPEIVMNSDAPRRDFPLADGALAEESKTWGAARIIQAIISELGITIAPEKEEFHTVSSTDDVISSIKLLGFDWLRNPQLLKMLVSAPLERVEKALRVHDVLLDEVSAGKPELKTLQRFSGIFESLTMFPRFRTHRTSIRKVYKLSTAMENAYGGPGNTPAPRTFPQACDLINMTSGDVKAAISAAFSAAKNLTPAFCSYESVNQDLACLYTDASFNQTTRTAQLGFVLVAPGSGPPVCGSCKISARQFRDIFPERLGPKNFSRTLDIGDYEALAVYWAVSVLKTRLKNRRIILYVDNAGVVYSLVSMSSKSPVTRILCRAITSLFEQIGTSFFAQYVHTERNLADLPSRDKIGVLISSLGCRDVAPLAFTRKFLIGAANRINRNFSAFAVGA